MELSLLLEQNRFWEDRAALKSDPHIKALSVSPLKITHPAAGRISLNEDRVYIIRGPRQVGKTTLLKATIKKLLDKNIDPRRVLYFAFDIGGIKDNRDVLDLLKTYLGWIRRYTHKRVWILLDEVTYTPDWSTGVKAAFDLGILGNATLVATGSSSIDLKKGGDRLPGRRGIEPEKNDIEMLPLSFRSFLASVQPGIEIPTISGFSCGDIHDIVTQISFHGNIIKRAFEIYLICGGYPLSMVSYHKDEKIDESVFYTYLQTILGDIAKGGKREIYSRELLYALISKRFEPVTWDVITQMTSIGSHNTVAEYIDFFEASFVLKSLYQTKSLGGRDISFRKRRKVYFIDPFTFHTLNAWCGGSPDSFATTRKILTDSAIKGKIAENVIGIHLIRYFHSVLFWRNKCEIDFICIKERSPYLYIESKHQPIITSDDKVGLKKVGGGVILSRDTLAFDETNNIAILPVSYFLAGLGA